MIGYFVKAGDPDVGNAFQPWLLSFRNIIHRTVAPKSYGDDLRLILIEYDLEGKFMEFPKREYRVYSYRRNERSMIVMVGVREDFGTWPDPEKRRFIVESTLHATELAREKMLKLGYPGVDFEQLMSDLHLCAKEYLDAELPKQDDS